MSVIAGQMLKGGMWIAAARALTNALGFVSTIVLARLLSPADFGLFALATTIVVIAQAVTAMPVTEALVRMRDPSDEHYHSAWSIGLVRSLIIAAILALTGHLAAWLYHEPRLEPIMYALAGGLLVSGFSNPRTIMLNKGLIFWLDFVLGVGEKLTTVVVSILLAIVWHSYWALVIGMIAGQVLSIALSYIALPFRPRFMFMHARELWSFSVWLSFGQIINTINWRFDQFLVAGYLGNTALGAYSVGDNLAQLPTREATAPLTRTLYPALSLVAHDAPRLQAAYQRSQSLIVAIALPAGIGFASIADVLINGLMGVKWAAAVPVAQALAAVFALQTLGSMVQPLGMAKGATKLLFTRDLQMFFVRLPFIVGGIMLWGLPGLIGARVFTGSVAALVNMVLVRKLIGLTVRAQIAINWRSLTAALAMASGVITLRTMWPQVTSEGALIVEIAVLCITGAALYAVGAVCLWLLTGRPDGPEREITRLATGLLARRSSKTI